ncbi:MAG: 30S ribosomal protein S16 [Pseudomonadota bacterium]
MAVKIRLARYGAKKKPFYRVVAADAKAPRDGGFIEILGTYDPRNKTNGLKLDVQSVRGWVEQGAEMTNTVKKLFKQSAEAVAKQE